MFDHLFRLSNTRFARPGPLTPNRNRGVRWVDGRRVIPGIIRVPRNGPVWRGAPTGYGRTGRSATALRGAGVFNHIFEALAADGRATDTVMIYAHHLKASAQRPIDPARKESVRAVSGASGAGPTRSRLRSATAEVGP